jgi:hypothetical protein
MCKTFTTSCLCTQGRLIKFHTGHISSRLVKGMGMHPLEMDSLGMGHPHLSLLIPKAIPFYPHAIPTLSPRDAFPIHPLLSLILMKFSNNLEELRVAYPPWISANFAWALSIENLNKKYKTLFYRPSADLGLIF